jgi:Mn-containing catalase
VDGGDGSATVRLTPEEESAVAAFAMRDASDVNSDPVTGADLGADGAESDSDEPESESETGKR